MEQVDSKVQVLNTDQIKEAINFILPMVGSILLYFVVSALFFLLDQKGIGAIFITLGFPVVLIYIYTLVLKSVPKSQGLPISKQELVSKLLSFNNQNCPLKATQDGDSLVFYWNLADASWYEFFSKARIESDYTLTVYLVESSKEARVIEETKRLDTKAGLPTFKASASYFRGWTPFTFEKEVAYGIKDINPVQLGKLYDLKLNTGNFRKPILELIANSGWKIHPCVLSLKLGI
ncbi:MAG: hypothetical protein EHM20_16550 [Alphaproteobacteria bacterium]|nr:MAG: hypothetical protein EHM20_16550 [Alphaproteobacteria bacterium]